MLHSDDWILWPCQKYIKFFFLKPFLDWLVNWFYVYINIFFLFIIIYYYVIHILSLILFIYLFFFAETLSKELMGGSCPFHLTFDISMTDTTKVYKCPSGSRLSHLIFKKIYKITTIILKIYINFFFLWYIKSVYYYNASTGFYEIKKFIKKMKKYNF